MTSQERRAKTVLVIGDFGQAGKRCVERLLERDYMFGPDVLAHNEFN